MRKLFNKKFIRLLLIGVLSCAKVNAAVVTTNTPEQWVKAAIADVFDPKNKEYTHYISTNYIEHIDGKIYNFQQWVQHMNEVKATLKSYQLIFNSIVARGDQIAVSYDVNAIKNDNSKLAIHIIAIFKIQNNKMIYADELTHVSGNLSDYAK